MSVTIRVSEETRTAINQIAEKTNMSVDAILTYFTSLNEKYDFFNVNWIKELVESEVAEYLKDIDAEFAKKIELQKNKAVINAQMLIFKEWMNTLDRQEKKQFLENVMGANKGTDFLEKLANYQMYVVDGYKKLYPPDQDGYPQIPFISKTDIVRCRRGYHIVNNRCDCRLWTECDLGSGAFEDWLGKHGTQAEQRKYLEETSGQKYYLRRY